MSLHKDRVLVSAGSGSTWAVTHVPRFMFFVLALNAWLLISDNSDHGRPNKRESSNAAEVDQQTDRRAINYYFS